MEVKLREPNNSPEYRLECEAKLVMQWDRLKREAYYKAIQGPGERGKIRANELIAEVNKLRREEQRKQQKTQGMEI